MTVTVKQQESTRWYYVNGEVRSPARQIYNSRITVLKAIASAGGFTDFANKKKVKLTRVDGRTQTVNCVKALDNPSLGPGGLSRRHHPCSAPALVMVQLKVLSGKKAGTFGWPAVFLYASDAPPPPTCNWRKTACGTNICNSTSIPPKGSSSVLRPTRWLP